MPHSNTINILTLSILTILFSFAVSKPWPAARCMADGEMCNFGTARRSEVCVAKRPSEEQSTECVEQACSYCLRNTHFQTKYPCDSPALGSLCGYMVASATPSSSPVLTPSLTPSISPSASPSAYISASVSPTISISPSVSPATPTPVPSGCVWTNPGGDDVVIDLSRVAPASGWMPCYRAGYPGLIYKQHRNRGIDKKGEQGVMCFDVQAPMSGTYFLTALSYAPHNTEHNDVWVSSSKGFDLWRRGVKHSFVKPGIWRKAYQNFGTRGIAQFFKTIDFNGHRFLIPDVEKDETFQVCLSGRSYRYEMFRLALIKCEGVFCTGGVYKDIESRAPGVCSKKDEMLSETTEVTPEPRNGIPM